MNNPFFDPQNQNDSLFDNFNDDKGEETPSEQTVKTLRKFIAILLSIGLVIGIISAWTIAKLMDRYGLTEKTNQIEQLRNR